MKNIAVLLFMSFILTNGDNETVTPSECSTPATIRNLSGLDGCGYVFELNDGTMLLPSFPISFCSTPPQPKYITEDPLYNFDFEDGKKVFIDYVEVQERVTACMAGKSVKITCIKEAEASSRDL